MGSEKILLCFINIPIVLITKRSKTSFLMNFLYLFAVFFGEVLTVDRLLQEESIMHVSGRVTLWLEQSIEVPE